MKKYIIILILSCLSFLASGCSKEPEQEQEVDLTEFYLKSSELLAGESTIRNYKQYYEFQVPIEEEAVNRSDDAFFKMYKDGMFQNEVDFVLFNGSETRTYPCSGPFGASAQAPPYLVLSFDYHADKNYLQARAYKSNTIMIKGRNLTDEERLNELFAVGEFLGLKMSFDPELTFPWDDVWEN